MIARLLPVLLAVIGLAGGVGAGYVMRQPPPVEVAVDPCGDAAGEAAGSDAAEAETSEDADHDYVKLNNQFVVPIVDEGRVGSLVVMALSLEVPAGQTEMVYEREPKLRDAFLQVMFDHANAGGFKGAFTSSTRMTVLRNALREVARKTLGPSVSDVLIIEFVRQDA